MFLKKFLQEICPWSFRFHHTLSFDLSIHRVTVPADKKQSYSVFWCGYYQTGKHLNKYAINNDGITTPPISD